MIGIPLLFALLASTSAQPPAIVADAAVAAARRAALELAGAWSNDGFKLRDSYWAGRFEPDKSRVVEVSLFAGNRYWFTAAAPGGGALAVTLYDGSGMPVRAETYQDGARAAAGFSPDASGTYFVKVDQRGDQNPVFCLLYSYK